MNQNIRNNILINLNPLEKRERLRFILLLVFVFVLPFDIIYSNIVLFLLIITTLLDFKLDKLKKIPKQVWIFQVIYFLSVIGYLYSYHKSEAGFLLERQLAILLIPILLPLAVNINEKRKKILLYVFLLSIVITVNLLFFNLFISLKQLHLPFSSAFGKDFLNHHFSAPIGIHAGYLSLYVSICVIYTLQLIMENKSKKMKVLLILFFIILLAGLLFLASRNIIISTLLIICFIFPLYYIKKKTVYILIATCSILISFIGVSNISYFKKRFTTELIGDIKLTKHTDNFETTEPRIDRWKCAIKLVKKSPIIGYGTGDEVAMLKTEYIKNGLYISYLEEFNAHNQYISYLIKNGFIGLIAFLFTFLYFVKLAIKGKDYIYVTFLILLLVGFFTENILDANKGIFFFALFNTFFGYNIFNRIKDQNARDSTNLETKHAH